MIMPALPKDESSEAIEYANGAKEDLDRKRAELTPLIGRLEEHIKRNKIFEAIASTLRKPDASSN